MHPKCPPSFKWRKTLPTPHSCLAVSSRALLVSVRRGDHQQRLLGSSGRSSRPFQRHLRRSRCLGWRRQRRRGESLYRRLERARVCLGRVLSGRRQRRCFQHTGACMGAPTILLRRCWAVTTESEWYAVLPAESPRVTVCCCCCGFSSLNSCQAGANRPYPCRTRQAVRFL